jgi:hypothetical protein
MITSSSSGSVAEQLADLRHQLGLLQDAEEVRKLHFKYGYYQDKCLYEEVVGLFADNCEVRFGNGLWRGRAGARRLYCEWFGSIMAGGGNGPPRGFLVDHLHLQDIIDVARDRLSAKARARVFLQVGTHSSLPVKGPAPRQFWESGIYENEYVKEDEVWKIRVLNYNLVWHASYEGGWAGATNLLPPLTRTVPEDPFGPDELLTDRPKVWPEPDVVPFHYPHPVSGLPWR